MKRPVENDNNNDEQEGLPLKKVAISIETALVKTEEKSLKEQRRDERKLDGGSMLEMAEQERLRRAKQMEAPKMVSILVDGYYGDHASMNVRTYKSMCSAVMDQVYRWGLKPEYITWISLTGTWAKAIPMTLMQQGLGAHIDFYLPCSEYVCTFFPPGG